MKISTVLLAKRTNVRHTECMSHDKKIVSFFKKYKRMPSYKELANIFEVRSKDSAFRIAKQFIDSGFLKKDYTGKLIPGDRFDGVRMLGFVEAGFPTPAEEDLLETITLDEYLIDNKEATFMLRVKGDSMYDAGIREGDMVLAERTTQAKTGAIVIAELDGQFTMKYLRKQGSYFFLEPANKNYPPLYPKESLRVVAVVKAIIRKFA